MGPIGCFDVVAGKTQLRVLFHGFSALDKISGRSATIMSIWSLCCAAASRRDGREHPISGVRTTDLVESHLPDFKLSPALFLTCSDVPWEYYLVLKHIRKSNLRDRGLRRSVYLSATIRRLGQKPSSFSNLSPLFAFLFVSESRWAWFTKYSIPDRPPLNNHLWNFLLEIWCGAHAI